MTQLVDAGTQPKQHTRPAFAFRPGLGLRFGLRPSAAASRPRGDFLLLWAGQTVSKIGNGAYKIAAAWAVYQIAGSTADMGIVLALNLVPELALVLLGGTIADRVSRRAVVIAADGVAAAVTFALAIAAALGVLSVSLLMVAAFLLGVVSAFYGPAYAAMRREVVDTGRLRAANAWMSVSGNLARMAGPALAGVAFAFGGAGAVFGLDAATFAFAVVTALLIRTRTPARAPVQAADGPECTSVARELAEGLAYTAKSGWLVLLLALSLIANLACLAPYAVLLPAVVVTHGAGIDRLGLLSAAEIAVGIAGAIAIGRFGRRLRPGITMLVFCSLLGAGTLLLGLSGGRAVLLFAGVALIGAGLSFDVIEQTLMQSFVPEHLLSRVYALNTVVSYSLLPVGYAVSGIVAKHTGASPVLIVGGAALIASCASAVPLPVVHRLNAVDY